MNSKLSLSVKLAALALLLGTSISSYAAVKLEQIKVNPLLTDQLVLELDFDGAVSQYTDRLKYQPNQLFLHVPQSQSALPMNQMAVERHGVEQVVVQPSGDGLDISVSLMRLMPYQIQQDGERLLVTLGQAPVAAQASAVVASPVAVASKPVRSQASSPAQGGLINQIKSLDFRRGKTGQGQLLVELNNSSAAVDVSRRGSHVVAKFHATGVADDLIALMDVNDFSTPVSKIDVSRGERSVTLDLAVNGGFDYRYDQADNLFIIEVNKKAEPKTGGAKSYQGKPISLNFQDVPVRTVLQLIADFNHFNLVVTDSVAGNITLRLDGVPWEQALDTVLKVKGLDKRLDNNILLVAPASELAAQEKQTLETSQQVAELAPLQTEYIQINYAKATDVAKLLSGDETRLLSSRGAVSVDERTNMLLIKDTADVIDHVKKMITVLDIPVKQVVIEARMVTIDDGVEQDLGVRWGVTKANNDGGTSGTIEGNDDGTSASVDDRLNVNLPVANAAGSIAFQVAKLADGLLLDLELSALEQENKAEIIASPRVTTANQKEAVIEQGTEFPSNVSTSSGATSIEWKKAVLSLKVTPQITPDNKVILDLTVTQDTLGDQVQTGTGTGTAVNTQQISTQVLVDNGETLVLGGIYQQTIKKDVTKVPVLGDIPGVGVLFRNTSESNKKRELLIFVTPKIVADSL
ncbi:type IV pilus secretin PilQ family protein [Pseudaeromonas paramecii]|uniref:Type IV pilus secretin PilQ family protein n=1 Tax=Pseudaeromonas paramecii TaxID=2138166 RepID=A0ABP8QBS6_9GAMM